MVGMVLVSHSRPLVEALLNLVRQVGSEQAPIAVAAGVGDQREELGTDAVEISEAIQSVYSPDGVLVMMDLGSAILSAEMALELLPSEIAGNIRFCDGPFVEGAIAAGVQIGLGSDLNTVWAEARGALLPKQDHLGGSAPGAGQSVAASPSAEAVSPGTPPEEAVLALHNLHGLHARPAARFVQAAASFDADIRVTNLTTGKGPVSARSLNAIATLGALQNHQIRVQASGRQSGEALAALSRLVEGNFGEPTSEAEILTAAVPALRISTPEPAGRVEPGGSFQAVPVSEGAALGPLYCYRPALPPIPEEKIDDPEAEWRRFQEALETTRQAIRQRRRQVAASAGEEESAIFDAHALILEDPDLLDGVRAAVFQSHANAASAWNDGIRAVAASYQALPDPYMQQRAADVVDVGNQVLFALAGGASAGPVTFPEPVVLFAEELTPTETAQLDMTRVLALITAAGGPTSHSAILARALAIPAVSGAPLALESLQPRTLVGVDGFSGQVWLEPSLSVQKNLQSQRADWLEQRRKLLQKSTRTAATRDGHRVEVAGNAGNLQDARAAVQNGAEGIGLLRTEFLYLTRSTPPSEADQVEILSEIGAVMGDRPVIVRTLDVGGDKELPYISLAAEANPFLGVRAIRLSFQRPDLFLTQLRATLRAGANSRMRIMFPMVANLDEVLRARAFLEQAHRSLEAEKLDHRWPIETGIMVEIPAAALQASVLAQHVDFFSIGTNDLTQYTLAAERGSPALAGLSDALHPAVLRLIGDVAEAAHRYGKWVGVCGELAGDPLATAVLTGLGVDELSLNPGGIPRVKAILGAITMDEAHEIAAAVLKADGAPAARQAAKVYYQQQIEPRLE